MKFAGIEVRPIVKRDPWSRFRRKKNVELEIRNLDTHSVRISSIPTDLDKVEVTYLKTDKGKIPIQETFQIEEGQSLKIGVKIRSSLKEWFWSGTNLCEVPLQIYTSGAFNPEDASVFAGEARIQSMRSCWITIAIAIVIVCGIALSKLLFFPQSNYDVSVSSKPQGRNVIVNNKFVATTPTLLKLDGDSEIEIGDSDKRRVRDVLEDGCIFFPNERWDSQTEEKK